MTILQVQRCVLCVSVCVSGSVVDAISSRRSRIFRVQILTVAFSRNGDLFAIASSSKQCAIFDCGAHREWTLVHAFSLPKWPTAVVFDHSNDHLLVADRAGHVLRYSLLDKGSFSMSHNADLVTG